MQFIDAATLADRLEPRRLVAALRDELGAGVLHAPTRHAHILQAAENGQDSLLIMPGWREGEVIGVKLVTVMMAHAAPDQRSVNAVYVLFDATTGAPQACLDGEVLTARRTAAQSALAAQFLARPDATRLLMVGTGALSQAMVEGHAAMRSLTEVVLWGRDRGRAEARARSLAHAGIAATIASDLEEAACRADIICCATTAREPVVKGQWLRSGQHLDLVGSFRPDMCETDTSALARAAVFVDTREGCLAEAGEITQAIGHGDFQADDIRAELADLCSGSLLGRQSEEEITLFKSVGTALADLVAARLALRSEDHSV